MPMSAPASPRSLFARRALAALGAATAGGFFLSEALDDDVLALGFPVVALFASAALVFVPRLSAQLGARAVIWANLILGTLITISGSASERDWAFGMVAALGTALLALGRTGLDDARSPFSPAKHKGPLTLMLVLALADTVSLYFWGALQLESIFDGHHGGIDGGYPLAFPCALLMTAALVGLYRLRVWGMVLNVVGNVVVAGLGISGLIGLPEILVVPLVATAVVQLVLPIPLMFGLATKNVGGGVPPALLRAVPTLTVLALMAVSAAAFVLDVRFIHA